MRSSAGICWRESPSQRAQKFTSTTWPRNSERRRFLPSMPRNTKSGASLPTILGAAAIDDWAIAALTINDAASNALRMLCKIQIDAAAPRLINHAGNPAVLGTPVDRKLCALAFRRVCPDQTLCKIAQCEPQCQRNDCAFTLFLYDLAHIRANFPRATDRETKADGGDTGICGASLTQP